MANDRNIGVAAATEGLDPASVGAPSTVSGESAELELFDIQDAAEGPLTAVVQARRGPGRPPGSPNKRTADLRRFILSRYKHPVIAAAEIYSMPAALLAAALDCDPRDAVLVQVRCMEFVGPYIEAKMPQKIAISDADRLPEFHLHFGQGGAELRDGQGARVDLVALAARAKRAMDQRLIEGEAARAQDEGAHGEANPQSDQGDGQA